MLAENNVRAKLNLTYANLVDSDFHLDIDTVIPSQGVTVIFGESGSGKTTLLRCIAGLEKVPCGVVKINQKTWQEGACFVPTHKRELGYVFQEASLFEHLNAQNNLRYAIKRSGKKQDNAFLQQVIDVLGIAGILNKYPSQLSGGERQRVAIARALLIKPKILLMDEPLASLDKARKQEILPYLEGLHQAFNIPILYVTHSIDEVVRLADYVLIMQNGKLAAEGSLTELFSRVDMPLGVTEDLGAVLECQFTQLDEKWNLAQVSFAGGQLWLPHTSNFQQNKNQLTNFRVRILASDISISLVEPRDVSILNVIEAKVADISSEQKVGLSVISLDVGTSKILASLTTKSVDELGLKQGDKVWAMIKSVAIVR
jgi:molybdate transport system ATP-binding protein